MDDPILSKLSILKPRNALFLELRETNPSLIPLVKVLLCIATDDHIIQLIDDQWRRLPIMYIIKVVQKFY